MQMDSSSSQLTSIPGSSLRVLAALLRLPPEMMMTARDAGELPAKWLAQQKQVVEAGDLPAELLSSSPSRAARNRQGGRLVPRWNLGKGLLVQALLVMPLPSSHHNSGEEKLCEAHQGLNRDLIAEVYHLVRKEVIVHGEGARSWLRHVGRHEEEKGKNQDWGFLRGFVEGMVGIVTLMEEFQPGNGRDEERWEEYFGRGVGMEEYMKKRGFQRVGNGCLACVLGVIGGRIGMVIGLRGSCLGRARRRTPKLLGRWLPGWVEGFGIAEQLEIRERSEEIAGRVREVRGWQRERFEGGRKGEWVSPRLTRQAQRLGLADGAVPGVHGQGEEHGGEERGEQQHKDDGNEHRGSNNPYHQSVDNRSPSPPAPSQPGPFGGFDGHFDDDDETYRQLIDDIIPDRYHIHSPMPPASALSNHENDERRGYVPPRQSWTAYPSPLFSLRHHRNQPPDHPCQPNAVAPPPSSSESYYADEIYDQYHTSRSRGNGKPMTKASTISPGRPRPEEYDGLVTADKEALLSSQHQRRLNDCCSEKSMKSRLKRRLEGSSSRSKMSSSGRTQWVDFF